MERKRDTWRTITIGEVPQQQQQHLGDSWHLHDRLAELVLVGAHRWPCPHGGRRRRISWSGGQKGDSLGEAEGTPCCRYLPCWQADYSQEQQWLRPNPQGMPQPLLPQQHLLPPPLRPLPLQSTGTTMLLPPMIPSRSTIITRGEAKGLDSSPPTATAAEIVATGSAAEGLLLRPAGVGEGVGGAGGGEVPGPT